MLRVTSLMSRLGLGPVPISGPVVRSPWRESTSKPLQKVLWNDIFGVTASALGVTRAEAMSVPAIARGRNRIVAALAGAPLVQMDRGEPTVDQPSWLSQVPNNSPYQRMAWTLDDHIFYGWSAWSRSPAGPGARIPYEMWRIGESGQFLVGDSEVPLDEFILIPAAHEGILNFGRLPISDALALYAAVRRKLASPVPNINLHQTGGEQMTDDEIDSLIARWIAARRGDNGGVSYTNELIVVEELGAGEGEQLLIEGRNAAAVEMARLLNMSAGHLDATSPKASLNYETQQGRDIQFYENDLAIWADPIEARLSLDDVCAPGLRVAFDLSSKTGEFLPTGAPVGD